MRAGIDPGQQIRDATPSASSPFRPALGNLEFSYIFVRNNRSAWSITGNKQPGIDETANADGHLSTRARRHRLTNLTVQVLSESRRVRA